MGEVRLLSKALFCDAEQVLVRRRRLKGWICRAEGKEEGKRQ